MELFRALGALAERPDAATTRLAEILGLDRAPTAEEHTALFHLELSPYASVYLNPEGMLGGEARDRVAGFWRAVGQDPPGETDHVAVLMATYASLADLEQAEQQERQQAAFSRMRSAFLWEHLLSWLPPFLDAVQAVGPAPYRQWGRLVDEALETEARRTTPPDSLSMHLKQHLPLASSDEDTDALLAGLLAPVRSGLVLTGSDLVRAARDTGLARRAGERRFVLRAFLEQDPSRVWPWLAEEANRWAIRHEARRPWLASIAAEWAARARATARLLSSLSPSGAGR
jgi:TorA maturation chaperone TorD